MSSLNVTPPTTGLVAGKFQLEGLLGRGGMGSVWRGRHTTLNTVVAIKFIEAEYANSSEARRRFDREARAAATIESKHAIKIYDHGVTDDGKPFIVMELLVGEPLDKRIERLRQLTLQDTARILQQVCRGLQRAHERGIVHRDLKPENVYLTRSPEDDEEIVKVLDFGIAKEQGTPDNPGMTSSTKTGAVLGTPYYMSPEQARGLKNVDHRTDLWSIGVIAFKCLAGKLPFDGESVGDLLVKICTAPVPVPSQVVAGLPSSFDAWFMRALERDPERRFQSAQELGDALAYAAGLSALRGPSSLSGGHMAPHGAGGTVAGNVPLSVHGMPVMTPPGSPMAMGTPPPGAFSGAAPNAATPPPAGMTNAPFTSSGPVPGVPSGRGKWIAIAGVAGLVLGVAAVAGTVVYKQRSAPLTSATGLAPTTATATATATTTGAAPSSTGAGAGSAPSSPSTAPLAEAPSAPTLPTLVPAKTVPTAPAPTAKAPTRPVGKPGAAPTVPATATAAPTTTPTATATATPAPTATPKKPPPANKDPGY